MTYSLNTLNADRTVQPSVGVSRFAQEIALVLGAAALVFWLISLLTHSLSDPAWSTTGASAAVGNWGGRLGAFVADASYYLLGYSVWWVFLVGVRLWLSTLARWIRAEGTDTDSVAARWWQRPAVRRVVFWLALMALLLSSGVLEWSRLHRFEPTLPGPAGGVVGELLGPWVLRWLGFTGAALAMLAIMVLCLPRVFSFSWGHWAEVIGQTVDGWFEARREKREEV